MRQNSIGYPGERPAKRADIVEQPGYNGKNYFVVDYAGRQLTVHAADETAAQNRAAKRWGYSFKRPEYRKFGLRCPLHSGLFLLPAHSLILVVLRAIPVAVAEDRPRCLYNVRLIRADQF